MMMSRTARLRRISSVVMGAGAVIAALSAAPARAATDAEQAEALIREGVQLRSRDNAAKALPLFEKAYQISRSPRTAAQLGLCELELANYVGAESHLAEALTSPEHPWVAKNKATLKKSLETARANVGELLLTVTPADADVSLGPKLLDRAQVGAPVRLGKGPVDVEVRASGYATARETVTIAGGKREQRTYTLVREAAPSVASANGAGAAWAGAPASEPGGTVALVGEAPPAQAGSQRTKRLAAWITGGAAVAAAAFGTVEAISAAGKSSAFNDHTAIMGGVSYHDCGTANLSPACKGLKDDYDSALRLSIIGFVAAGALAATSSVLFVLSSGNSGGAERGAVRAFACVPDPVGRGLGCSLRF
jgi:hypothetical protein